MKIEEIAKKEHRSASSLIALAIARLLEEKKTPSSQPEDVSKACN